MADASDPSPATPLALRLSVPGVEPFLGVATDLVGRFAEAAGLGANEAESVRSAFARAAASIVSGHRTDPWDLAIDLQQDGQGIEIRVSADGAVEVLRSKSEHPGG